MLKWLDWTGRILLAAFAVTILYRFWLWWEPSSPQVYLRTDLVNAQKADLFFTGFATVAVVRFATDDGQFVPFSSVVGSQERVEKVKGFCYRLYELSVGYPSLAAAIERSELDEKGRIESPRVLSGNVVDARHGGDVNQYQCDEINLVLGDRSKEKRLQMLQDALVENGQWPSHVDHAERILLALSEKLRDRLEAKLKTLEERKAQLARVDDSESLRGWAEEMSEMGEDFTADVANEDLKARLSDMADRTIRETKLGLSEASGYLGSLKLTFSTIGIFSQVNGRWFWKSDQFYIRQDTAEATYGSEFSLDLSGTSGFFGGKRFVVTIPEPSLLSLDRYTSVLVRKPPKFTLNSDDPAGGSIEKALSEDLETQLSRIRPQAIRFAKAILTAQIHELVRSDVGEIVVKFSSPELRSPDQLMELVRLAREQRDPSR